MRFFVRVCVGHQKENITEKYAPFYDRLVLNGCETIGCCFSVHNALHNRSGVLCVRCTSSEKENNVITRLARQMRFSHLNGNTAQRGRTEMYVEKPTKKRKKETHLNFQPSAHWLSIVARAASKPIKCGLSGNYLF